MEESIARSNARKLRPLQNIQFRPHAGDRDIHVAGFISATIEVGASKATTFTFPVAPACFAPFAAPIAEKRFAPKTPARSDFPSRGLTLPRTQEK
jgi:hypothetical protein